MVWEVDSHSAVCVHSHTVVFVPIHTAVCVHNDIAVCVHSHTVVFVHIHAAVCVHNHTAVCVCVDQWYETSIMMKLFVSVLTSSVKVS